MTILKTPSLNIIDYINQGFQTMFNFSRENAICFYAINQQMGEL